VRDEVISRLRSWLLRQNPSLADREIGPDTDVIETGVLDSLQLVEFILLVELESGKRILSERIDGTWLRTLGGIYDHFFAAEAA
jgi:acyl carrier protein